MPLLNNILFFATVLAQVETGAKFEVHLRCTGALNNIATQDDEWATGSGGHLLYRIKVGGRDDPNRTVYKVEGPGPTLRLRGTDAEGTFELSSGKIQMHFNDRFLQGFYAATCRFIYVRGPTNSSTISLAGEAGFRPLQDFVALTRY